MIQGTKTEQAMRGKPAKTKIKQAMSMFGDFIGMAERFIEIQPVYYDSSTIWWVWDHKSFRWSRCDDIDILNAIDDYYNIMGSTEPKIKSQIIESLKRVGRRNKPNDPKLTWVQFMDNIIDIETGQRFKASPLFFITNPIPHKLGESDETPVMDRIFTEWVGEDKVPLLYDILAYCLIPDYPLHRIFCFLGGGLNGKSKFLDLVKRFIGQDNITSTELEDLIANKFHISKLFKKLVCIMGETNFSQIKKSSMLKKLSGGDLINFEFKRKDPFDEHNYAKLLIATNNLPSTTDKTIGFYRRWVIVDFPNQFDETKDILSEIPPEEYENLALKCIRLLKRILKERNFTNEGDIDERMKRFEEKSNPLLKFMDERVVEDFTAFIFKHEFRKELDEWCRQNNFRKISDHEITREFQNKHTEVKRQASWTNDTGISPYIRAWEGMRWKGINKKVTEKKKEEVQEEFIR